MTNFYSPAVVDCEITATMSLDDKGNWVHIAEYKKQQEEIERLRDKLVGYMNETQTKAAEIERLRGVLVEAPCTCPNPWPCDYPHDPANTECYKNIVQSALEG